MSKQDGMWFGLAGALVWGAATLFYVVFARGVIEHAFWFYVVNAALVAMALGLFFHITLRFLRTPRRQRRLAALIFAAPGLTGAMLLGLNFSKLLPQLPPESLGRYTALVLVGYAIMMVEALEPKPRKASARG
ncbi:DUF5367 family protein [Phenylobacterium sp.]|uniref:DUF5367 family protein n=1 Tax=Phenylobacterium sp. TaxID=1871053 RepID=UPI003BACC786